MEKYLIVYEGKRYATNADNIEEAEYKFIQNYQIDEEDEVNVIVTALIGDSR
jgi:hypothetical protein